MFSKHPFAFTFKAQRTETNDWWSSSDYFGAWCIMNGLTFVYLQTSTSVCRNRVKMAQLVSMESIDTHAVVLPDTQAQSVRQVSEQKRRHDIAKFITQSMNASTNYDACDDRPPLCLGLQDEFCCQLCQSKLQFSSILRILYQVLSFSSKTSVHRSYTISL